MCVIGDFVRYGDNLDCRINLQLLNLCDSVLKNRAKFYSVHVVFVYFLFILARYDIKNFCSRFDFLGWHIKC